MKKVLMALTAVLFVSSCSLASENSSSPLSQSEDVNSSSQGIVVEDSSSGSNSDTIFTDSSSSNEISSSLDSSNPTHSGSEDKVIDNSQKEYYKSLVNRDNIKYSEKLVNDENHDITKLEIFEINDTHGAFYDESSITGISRVKTCINKEVDDIYGCVKIANGDLLQGTAFSNMLLGEPAIAALNEMDFDCFVIGNHEFDWGIDSLQVYKDGNPMNGELNCPILGANIVDKNGNTPSWLDPYTVVKKGNVSVGIIGIIGDGLESSISKLAIGGYHFASTVDTVDKYCKVLKEEEKVDVIILSSHAHDERKNAQYVLNNDIDCIINGHDHQTIEEYVVRYDGVTVPVVESSTKNITLGKVELNLDSNKKMTSYSIEHFSPNKYSEDANLKSIMDEYYKVTADYQMEKIGFTNKYLTKDTIAIDTANYITTKYDADLTFVNTAGVRAAIKAGNITNADVYEVFPFDNEIYITYLRGDKIKKMIQYNRMSSYYYNDNTDLGCGSYYNFEGVDITKTYKVITIDYLATKDYMTEYFSVENGLIITGDYIRDCAIENIIENYNG